MSARRTRTPSPSPRRDWRALAADRVQRGLPLPVLLGSAPDADPAPADGADETRRDVPDGAADDDGLELRVRERSDGARYATLVGHLATDDPAVLDALGDRLHDAARAVEGSGS